MRFPVSAKVTRGLQKPLRVWYTVIMYNNNSLIGQRFSRLLVVSKDESKHGRTHWLCVCDCTKQCSASGKSLRSGKKKSCGCLRREMGQARAAIMSENNRLPEGESGFNLLYATYRCGATHRSLNFELSKEAFKSLTTGDCFYCGSSPNQKIGNELSGFYVYNGVDRKSNSIGYTIENSVSCCGQCNLMKRFMSPEDFISACRSVVNHFEKK